MAVTVTISGDDATFKHEKTADKVKVQNVLEKAALNLYKKRAKEGDPAWDDLTNQQKLDLLDPHLTQVLIGLARAEVLNTAAEEAKAAAAVEFDLEYDLGLSAKEKAKK